MQPSEQDPYRAAGQMSQVGGAGRGSGRRIRWVAGIISGLVGLFPFAVVTAVIWGFWRDEVDFSAVGWAILLVGLAAALTLGGYVATNDE